MTGKRLAEIRRNAGLEQWQLARALGSSTEQVSRWEDEIAPVPEDVAGYVLVMAVAL